MISYLSLNKGGFAYVYLVRELAKEGDETRSNSIGNGSGNGATKRSSRNASTQLDDNDKPPQRELVLKVTSISSRHQRDIAEKEAKLLSRLAHPSIVKMFDTAYRTVPIASSVVSGFRHKVVPTSAAIDAASGASGAVDHKSKERIQHMILMEYCDGGHALNICAQYKQRNERFDLSTLIIAFGQICNAVSYLHAQRPPIVHRDLKPENFLIHEGAYKLCDFGSAVFGHVELKTSKDRHDEEEVIEKTTTQMFRAPEMVDLFMAKKLTQATDVWALGCCLYALAFLKNCFEEGSNLAILSRNYKIPEDNPYGDGLVELIDRMLTQDAKARADMTEVILCLSAVYSGKPLPPRKERKSKEKKEKDSSSSAPNNTTEKKKKIGGTFRTDGQGHIENDLTIDLLDPKKVKEVKKLDPNSAAARRRQHAASGVDREFATFHSKFDEVKNSSTADAANQDLAFSTTNNPFASFEKAGGPSNHENDDGLFGSFNDLTDGMAATDDIIQAFTSSADWDSQQVPTTGNSPRLRGRERPSRHRQPGDDEQPMKTRSRSQDHRRSRRSHVAKKDETPEEAIERLAMEEPDFDDASVADTVKSSKKVVARRGVRRSMTSSQAHNQSARSLSRGAGLRRTKSSVDPQQQEGGNALSGRLEHDDDDDDSD
jgi:serine/threonine protein kinase